MRKAQSVKQKEMMGCPDCGALVRATDTRFGYRLRCPRCKATLSEMKKDSINRTLAFSFSGLMLFIPAWFLPILELNMFGLTGSCTMVKGVAHLFSNGFWGISFLVFGCSLLIPAMIFLLLLFITISVKFNYYTEFLKKSLKFYKSLNEWAMLDVYMLGILIAFVKMEDVGDISTSVGLFCFIGVLVFAVISKQVFDQKIVWNNIERTLIFTNSAPLQKPILCRTCSRLCYHEQNEKSVAGCCPRCNTRLNERKPDSISRTWAFVVTGFLLLIPANLCPITHILYYGADVQDTILSGISKLIRDDLIPIAILVFVASIIVPIFKLTGLTFLLSAVHFKWKFSTYQCTLMYRFISIIGRWSMLDLFMISILVTLVDMGTISTMAPGVGATAFASVVVVSMLAAINFDPRMLWDLEET